MTDAAIEVDHLGRTFRTRTGDIAALHDVSFSVAPGSIVGLLGENGAGKTTLTKILATLLLPSNGTARILGHDIAREVRAVRRDTGVVLGGDRGLYGKLSGRENLRFFAAMAGVGRRETKSRLDSALQQVHLTQAADRPVETYSKGMKQRLHIAIGMIANPQVLLLDEPTVGLDPVEAERLRQSVAELRSSGVTVLLTSHYLLDIERLAERVLILSSGRLAADLSVDEFAGLAGYTAVVTVRGKGPVPDGETVTAGGLEPVGLDRDGELWSLRLRVPSWDGESFAALGRRLSQADVLGIDVAPLRLEDVYHQVIARMSEGQVIVPAGDDR
jgi:ABC-2 type transport system ATP-binding protein